MSDQSVNNQLSVIDKEGNVDLQQIPSQELQAYQELASRINENDASSVINFGSEIQNSIASQSDGFLKSVRGSNSGEIGTLINNLLTELNYVDIDELEQSSFKKALKKIPLLGMLVSKVEKILVKYDTIATNIDKISNKVKAGVITANKDNAMLQTMFDGNLKLIKEIERLIIAGNLKYKEAIADLSLMESAPERFQDYQIADKREFVNRLDRRMADLKVVRYIMLQSLPQIRLVQNNNVSIAEKAQTILTTTLPVWKNQLSLAIAMNRQKQSIEVQQKISSTTEDILRKNAELLGQNARNVAKANEQTIVSLDTLRSTTQQLISTLNEVKQIQEKGTEQRRVLDTELQNLETELRKGVAHI
ncbi:toxic anion resistance protein [Edaphocola flava]|uniref:toxic anion resistance protein n=1 Tax=Edaphocola flava TaxID=2499629 RepID=UPI00100A337A|nr:toxic anion resistance protein [Edaphocola flava]